MGFDPEEFEGGEELDEEALAEGVARQERSGAVDDIVSMLTGTLPEQADDSYLTDVDRRLEVAQYYRELLRSSLFSEQTTSGGIVEREIRLFIRERLEMLLAIKATQVTPAPSQFSEDEVHVLRILVKEVTKRDAFQSPEKQAAPPTVKRAALPASKEVRRRSPPAGPTMVAVPPPASKPEPSKAPNKRPRKLDSTPAITLKRTVVANDGKDHEIEVQRIQRPSGALPFPSNMELATAAASIGPAQAGAKAASQILNSK